MTSIAPPFPALAVVGPTASGKSALALELGKRIDAEILCCDSMQIYRGMNIGTAKPTVDERAALPHHLLDLCEPTEPFNAADYAAAALPVVEQVIARGRVPLFCGGTGLYLEAARTGRHAPAEIPAPAFRAACEKQAESAEGVAALYARLCEIDPAAAEAIHPNNVRRVIRALEIYHTTGRTKSEWEAATRALPPALRLTTIGLRYADREVLCRRIDARVDAMLREGLWEEARELFARGLLTPDSTAGQAIGYKELLPYLRGEATADEVTEALKIATRRYAKRQMTWFAAREDVHWLTCDRPDGSCKSAEELVEESLAYLRESRFL